MRFHWRDSLLIWKMIFSLENDLQSPFIFILFLKSKQNKKETLNVTPYLEKVVCEKPNQGSGQIIYWKAMDGG